MSSCRCATIAEGMCRVAVGKSVSRQKVASLILRAAHCVEEFSVGAKAAFKLAVGIHFLAGKSPLIPEVEQVYIHRNRSGAARNIENGIALIRLARL